MSEQAKALRLADQCKHQQAALSELVPLRMKDCNTLDDLSLLLFRVSTELRRLHEVNAELLEALQLAVRQNSHDMLMTGEELRQCEAAISRALGQ